MTKFSLDTVQIFFLSLKSDTQKFRRHDLHWKRPKIPQAVCLKAPTYTPYTIHFNICEPVQKEHTKKECLMIFPDNIEPLLFMINFSRKQLLNIKNIIIDH